MQDRHHTEYSVPQAFVQSFRHTLPELPDQHRSESRKDLGGRRRWSQSIPIRDEFADAAYHSGDSDLQTPNYVWQQRDNDSGYGSSTRQSTLSTVSDRDVGTLRCDNAALDLQGTALQLHDIGIHVGAQFFPSLRASPDHLRPRAAKRSSTSTSSPSKLRNMVRNGPIAKSSRSNKLFNSSATQLSDHPLLQDHFQQTSLAYIGQSGNEVSSTIQATTRKVDDSVADEPSQPSLFGSWNDQVLSETMNTTPMDSHACTNIQCQEEYTHHSMNAHRNDDPIVIVARHGLKHTLRLSELHNWLAHSKNNSMQITIDMVDEGTALSPIQVPRQDSDQTPLVRFNSPSHTHSRSPRDCIVEIDPVRDSGFDTEVVSQSPKKRRRPTYDHDESIGSAQSVRPEGGFTASAISQSSARTHRDLSLSENHQEASASYGTEQGDKHTSGGLATITEAMDPDFPETPKCQAWISNQRQLGTPFAEDNPSSFKTSSRGQERSPGESQIQSPAAPTSLSDRIGRYFSGDSDPCERLLHPTMTDVKDLHGCLSIAGFVDMDAALEHVLKVARSSGIEAQLSDLYEWTRDCDLVLAPGDDDGTIMTLHEVLCAVTDGIRDSGVSALTLRCFVSNLTIRDIDKSSFDSSSSGIMTLPHTPSYSMVSSGRQHANSDTSQKSDSAQASSGSGGDAAGDKTAGKKRSLPHDDSSPTGGTGPKRRLSSRPTDHGCDPETKKYLCCVNRDCVGKDLYISGLL